MSRSTSKKGGGWRRPPREALIGRTDTALILGCDIKAVRRKYQDKGLLTAAFTETDGTEWFDREVVKRLARETGRRRSSTKLRAVRPAGEPARAARRTDATKQGGDYYPELRARREPLAPAELRGPVKVRPAPTKEPRTARAMPMPKAIGPQTEIRSEWWDGELPYADEDPEPEE